MRVEKTYTKGESLGFKVNGQVWRAVYVRALRVGSNVWAHEVELSASGRRVVATPRRVVELKGVEA